MFFFFIKFSGLKYYIIENCLEHFVENLSGLLLILKYILQIIIIFIFTNLRKVKLPKINIFGENNDSDMTRLALNEIESSYK